MTQPRCTAANNIRQVVTSQNVTTFFSFSNDKPDVTNDNNVYNDNNVTNDNNANNSNNATIKQS